MSLLELEHISKRYHRGSSQCHALRDVSLQLDEGELVAVWGLRGSGRSTLLRLAAGIEAPDTGHVRFDGNDLHTDGAGSLASGIGYCRRAYPANRGETVLEQLTGTAMALGLTPTHARTRARQALQRAGVGDRAQLHPSELDGAETTRVTIARALTSEPSLLLIDEPTDGVELLQRDAILALLCSLSHEGTAILTCVGESTALLGVDRILTLSNGMMRGHVQPHLAPVLELSQRARV
jgi:ABC-type lipoprotein export system ATPase subunit